MILTIIAAHKVPCPHCDAKEGEPCISSNGGFMRTVIHTARRRAALKAKEGNDSK